MHFQRFQHGDRLPVHQLPPQKKPDHNEDQKQPSLTGKVEWKKDGAQVPQVFLGIFLEDEVEEIMPEIPDLMIGHVLTSLDLNQHAGKMTDLSEVGPEK